jgi:hypothetical protein
MCRRCTFKVLITENPAGNFAGGVFCLASLGWSFVQKYSPQSREGGLGLLGEAVDATATGVWAM